jgi:hypothetical protein
VSPKVLRTSISLIFYFRCRSVMDSHATVIVCSTVCGRLEFYDVDQRRRLKSFPEGRANGLKGAPLCALIVEDNSCLLVGTSAGETIFTPIAPHNSVLRRLESGEFCLFQLE